MFSLFLGVFLCYVLFEKNDNTNNSETFLEVRSPLLRVFMSSTGEKNLTRGSQTISKIDKTATRGCMQSDFYGKLALSKPSLFGGMRTLSRASFGACSQASKIDVSLFVIFNFFQVEGLDETRDTIYNFIWINDGSTDRWLKTSILYSIWLPRLHVTS